MSEKTIVSTKKKRKWLTLFIVLFLLILVYLIIQFFKPTVILKNNTNKVVYVSTIQTEYGEEPTLEEVGRWRRGILLMPKQELKTSIRLEDLFIDKTMRLSNGWEVGGRSSQAESYGAQGVITSDRQGRCETYINIYDDSVELSAGTKLFCYKKLVPIKPDYY